MPETHAEDRTPVNIEELREWYAACEPNQPLEPGDPRYFDLGRAFEGDGGSPGGGQMGESQAPRGEYHVDRLYEPIELEDTSCQLFSGFAGTGKSTELHRLARRLEEEGYSVFLVDIEEYLDLHQKLAVEDLLVVLAGAFGEAVGERLGRDVVVESYWQRFMDFLNQEIEIQDLKLRLPTGIGELKFGIGHAQPFWLEARQALRSSLKKLRKQSHDFIRRYVDQVHQAEPRTRGVVFIVDNLEHVRPILGDDFRELMQSVDHVLTRHETALRLPGCHVIYTVPPYVQLTPHIKTFYDGSGFLLPAIKVSEPGLPLRPYKPGVEALVSLLARRIPVERIFEGRRDLLERLVLSSGGHVRTLISLTRDLLREVRRGGMPPTDRNLDFVIGPFRSRAELKMTREATLILDHILRRASLKGIPQKDHAVLADLMDDYLVLCYLNGENRYEVHPLIRADVKEDAAEIRAERS